MTSPNDLPVIKDIIHTVEKASGARLNPHKSKALAIAGWDATDSGLGIEFQPYLKILGVTFTELIKAGGRKIRGAIHELIIAIWNKEELPEEWKDSVIVPIHKKGDKTECNNYRAI